MISKQELIDFEKDIADLYCDAKIRAPIHLSDGNEDQLIKIFSNHIKPTDWVFSTWRSHYHALLHGIDKDWLKDQILKGNSITINKPDQLFFSSAIVGGTAPIALGTALAIKMKKEDRKVFVFIGDMTSECGVVYECLKYAKNFDLPLCFIIEDNDESVGTPTQKVWGSDYGCFWENIPTKHIIYYKYKKQWPHVGAGRFVTF